MDFDWLKGLGAVAGIGGIALGAVVYIFREIIRKEIFAKFTKEQSYKLLNKIILLIFIIGVLGILAYFILSVLEINNPPPNNSNSNSNQSKIINSNLNVSNSNLEIVNSLSNNSVNTSQDTSDSNLNATVITETKTPTITPNTNNNSPSEVIEKPTNTPFLHEISGQVLDAVNDKPILEARVSMEEFPKRNPITTTSNGIFVLEKVPKKLHDELRIRIEKKGYETEVIRVVVGKEFPPIYLEKKE